jgi:AraC-like DNA-binding protein
MRPQLRDSKVSRHSFSVRQDIVPHLNSRWHYHTEVELIHFKKGEGLQFIGDNIKRFCSGDVVLIGSHLPNYWRFDDVYFQENSHTHADVRIAHFSENFWGEQFLHLPENVSIKTLFEHAKRGLQITGKARQRVAELLEKLLYAEGPARIIYLIEALDTIANSKQSVALSSVEFRHDLTESESNRINSIYEYSLINFKRKIQLEEIASVANISPNAFCRYFKSRTHKTYSQFLTEIRVGHACRLLTENNLSIKELCYESGFNNFTSFHKYFKIITGKSPLNYQKESLIT